MGHIFTVGIATKNRALELVRCIQSLVLLKNISYEVIVVDDGSDDPVEPVVRRELNKDTLKAVSFVRWDSSRNLMAARNEIVRRAQGDIVLILDDDAYLLDGKEVELSLNVMHSDNRIGSLAYPECDDRGRMKKQPGKGTVPCLTTHFYGYAHAVRRDPFLKVGGYREIFWFYHEESDLCKKLLNLGYKCLYWPSALIAHTPSQVDRMDRDLRRFQYGLRNRCLDAMYNEPLPLCLLSIVGRCIRYFLGERKLRVLYGKKLTGGPWWLTRELLAIRSEVLLERKPLQWSVFVLWRWTRLRIIEYEVA